MKKIFQFILAVSTMVMAASCGEKDEFTESIFDTTIAAVDQNSATAPFDQWLYDTFVVPYNTEIQYKFNFTASDLNYQLTPADYKKSQVLAHMIQYLFYDVYDTYGEKDANGQKAFMRNYGPRILHFIGSSAYSPTTHTETLGYASAGVKITLINVNAMKDVTEDMEYTAGDINTVNDKILHTMHHEFSHILHQTKSYPVAFGQVTPSSYDGRTWQDRDSTDSHSLGYVTQYGSSAATEDFVETLSCTITDTDDRWMSCLIDACLNGGVKSGDKEQLYTLIDSLGIQDLDAPNKNWNNFSIYKELEKDTETGKFEPTGRYVTGDHRTDATKHADGRSLSYEFEKSFTSFRDYLDNWVIVSNDSGTGGINAILKKFDIATKWYTENYGLYLFTVRREVRYRQDHINDFLKSFTIYDVQ